MKRLRLNGWLLAIILGLGLLFPITVLAAATATPAPQVKFTALDSNGDPYVGGKLYTYETGTTTAKTSWTDSTKGTPNTNPVILDSRGQADVWIDSSGGAYRFKLKNADDVTLWTVDDIDDIAIIANAPILTLPTKADSLIIYDDSASEIKKLAILNLLGNVHYPDYNEADQGVTGSGSSVKAFVDAISTDSATLVFRHNSGAATTIYTFSTDETIPSNINVIIEKGAILSVDSAKTLTINNLQDPGLNQVFIGDGSKLFGVGSVKEVYPEWWGAVNVTGTDNSVALAAALTSGCNILALQKGVYDYSTGLTPPLHFTIKGVAAFTSDAIPEAASTLNYTGNGVAITANSTSQFLDFNLVGNDLATGGIYYGPATVSNTLTRRVRISSFDKVGGYGIRLNGLVTGRFEGLRTRYCYDGMVADGDNTTAIFINCNFSCNNHYGSHITYLRGSTFIDCIWESNYDSGLVISGATAYNIDFYNSWHEDNCRTSGTSDIIVTGAVGDLASKIKFHSLYCYSAPPAHAPGTGWIIEFDWAEDCILFYPDINEHWSYVKVSANTQNCSAFTHGRGAADGNHATGMYFFSAGAQRHDFDNGDTTPYVGAKLPTYRAVNTNLTVITDLDGGTTGQVVTLHIDDNKTTINDGGNFVLQRSVAGVIGTVITLQYNGTVWYEVSRNNNPLYSSTAITAGNTAYLLIDTDSAVIILTDITANKSAMYSLNGSADTTTELADPDNGFTPATGAVIWVKHDGAGSYRLHNEYGVTHTVRVTFLNQESK